jgi:hypothetical protein
MRRRGLLIKGNVEVKDFSQAMWDKRGLIHVRRNPPMRKEEWLRRNPT